MLFDSLEEQFSLPAPRIQRPDGQRRQVELVGEKDHMPVIFSIVELHAAQVLRLIHAGFRSGQHNGPIATQPRGCVHGARTDAKKAKPGLAPLTKSTYA